MEHEFLLKSAFIYNAFRSRLRNWRALEAADVRSNQVKQVRTLLEQSRTTGGQEALKTALSGASQLVYQAYASYILETLKPQLPGYDGLSIWEREGLHGLSTGLVRRALSGRPILSLPRGRVTNHQGPTTRPTFSSLPNTWESKMLGLFDLNDGLDRTWESCPFRRLVRRLWETISSAVDADCANRWLKVSLVRDAGCHLNCVPIYERDKLYKF